MSGEFGTGKTIFVLAIVVGCFAVLWPKIFYPMLTASITSPSSGRQVLWKDEANVFFLHQLCYLLEEQHHVSAEAGTSVRWTGEECWQVLKTSCGVEVSEALVSDVRLGKDKSNLTNCLATRYSLTPALVASAAPPRVRPRPYLPQGMGPHARPERPPHLYPEMMHPALREKGRAMPQRTIDKQARPGPMPGVRPPMGGAGGIVPPPQTKGSGAMGIIMPLYTVGIVVFFVYTIMKVLFKKGQDDDKTPKLKDFGLDPEYRKYVFAEEYLDNTDISSKDQLRRQAREESRNRKKAQNEVPPDTKIAEGHLMDQGRMDTQGKKLGNWYLPEGFLAQADVESDEEEYLFNCIGGTTVEESAKETLKERLFSGKNNKKDKKKKQSFIYEDINSEEDLQNIINMRQTERENEQRAQNAATKHDLEDDEDDEDDDDDENISDLDYLYSDEFLQILRKGLRNYDSEGNIDADTLENLCFVARDHLRDKYIENVVEKETQKFQHPFGKVSEPTDMQRSDDEEEAPEENNNPKDTRLDNSNIIRGNVVPSKLEGNNEDRPSFKEFESDDDLEFSCEQEKDLNRDDADNVPPKGTRDIFPNDTAEEMEGKTECEKKDEQLDQLRRRLEETEKAMERLMCQMGSVTDKLTAAKITEVLSQAQAQAKILKEEVGEMTSEEDLTSSEALTTTMSEETSLPASLQRHLEEIQKNEDSPTSSKGSSPDMDEYEVITKEEDHTTTTTKVKKLKEGAETAKNEPKMSAATTQKVEDTRKEVEEEAENEEEEEEEEEEIEEEVEFEEAPKKDSATKRPAVDTSAKTMPKSDAATEEASDDE